MTHGQPPRPANMVNIVAINQGKKPCTMREPEVAAIGPREAGALVDSDHAVLDTRSGAAFGEAHIPGAYHAVLSSSSFEQNAGWILPAHLPFVLAVDEAAQANLAARKLAFVGLDRRVLGFVRMGEWREAGMPVAGLSSIDVCQLQREVSAGRMRILDVREADEWTAGHIDSSANMSFKLLPERLDRLSLAPDERIAVVCAGGMRASTACSILRNRGFDNVYTVTGGMKAWRKAGLPVRQP